jgi:hypothetical protein
MDTTYQLTPHQIEELRALYQKEWWTIGRTPEETKLCVSGSQICIGIIDENGSLQGFARVITDFIFKALIFDVIVSEDQRAIGLGGQLIGLVKSHQKLRSVKHFELYCLSELEPFYQKHGFSTEVGGIRLMRLKN